MQAELCRKRPALVPVLTMLAMMAAITTARAADPYRSPFDVAFAPDGKTLAASDATAGVVYLIDPAAGKVLRQVALKGEPNGLAWSADGNALYAAEFNAAGVAQVSPGDGKIARRLDAGRRVIGVALAAKRNWLLAADAHVNQVAVIDLAGGAVKGRIDVQREPFDIAVTADEKTAIVSNLLPAGRASDYQHAAAISFVDLDTLKCTAHVKLPSGSASARTIQLSPCGKWAYVVHTVGRTNLPTTQLERGWVNTNALSIIDVAGRSLYATLLLDHPMQGAADPWGVVCSADGKVMWISIAGTHQLARIDLATLHLWLDGKLPAEHRLAQPQKYSPGVESVWNQIRRDPAKRAELVNDLSALYAGELIQRIDLEGNGPRGVALAPDGKTLAVAMHFSGQVALLATDGSQPPRYVTLGATPEPDLVRKGQIIFHDADYCFQQWLSCASCHPGEARVDGLNWDLLNDGIGNPKNVKSLLLSHATPPTTWTAAREDFSYSVRSGFIFMFRQPAGPELEAMEAYLKSLKPLPSPYLKPDGSLTDAAKRGKKIFESAATDCRACHKGELFVDGKLHNVGTKNELDQHDKFDTPTLIEAYRTAPYFHDGSAATLEEMFKLNTRDVHGKTSHLKPEELKDLIAYLMSL